MSVVDLASIIDLASVVGLALLVGTVPTPELATTVIADRADTPPVDAVAESGAGDGSAAALAAVAGSPARMPVLSIRTSAPGVSPGKAVRLAAEASGVSPTSAVAKAVAAGPYTRPQLSST